MSQNPPFPVLSIAAEDQGQMERFLDAGKPVRIHVNVQNIFTNGPIPSANVVGEISGTELILAGLPGINLEQDSPDYKYTHHSAADALEAAQPEALALNATIMATTSYWLADRPERFAAPWPPEKTARMLRQQGAYDRLKVVDVWPFGDLGEEPKAP